MSGPVQNELDLFSTPSPEIRRHFLGWDRPLLKLASDYLTRDWHQGPLDLSRLAVVVPTRNAARRLRESLAILSAERGNGVLPPQIFNPDDLLVLHAPPQATATRLESILAWVDTLRRTDLTNIRHLFPVDPVEKNFEWTLSTARDFTRVQSLLGEAARSASSAAKSLTEHESQRWAEFARLERRSFRTLEQIDRIPMATARRQAMEQTDVLPSGCDELVLLGLPDPPPAFGGWIEKLASHIPVTVVIHAPESHADRFDQLGRPKTCWTEQPIEIASSSIHQGVTPAEQTKRAQERLATHPEPHQVAAIGIPDPEVSAPLRKSLTAAGQATFDPAGTPLSQHGLLHLLRTLHDLSATRSLDGFREMLRCPGVAEAAGQFEIPDDSKAMPAEVILAAFDQLHEHHLPDTLGDIPPLLDSLHRSVPKAAIVRTLGWVQHCLNRLESTPLTDSLPAFLNEVYSHSPSPPDEAFPQAIALLHQALDELDSPALRSRAFRPLSSQETFQLLLTLLEEHTLTAERPHQAIDLLGWLELAWEDAPHLIITGFNEGFVPESTLGHPWLPDQARRLLGLRDNTSRHARDAYLLASLIASRREGGVVDLIFGRLNGLGDPLRPSRLLFATEIEALPERVDLLFQTPGPNNEPLPWQLAWKLQPPAPPEDSFRKISVTQFSTYLACPFRFYLKHGLGMEAPDLDRVEMNARDFGTLVHEVLERFAESTASTSDSETDIATCFDDLLSDVLARTFGRSLSVPLMLQEESARQRLRWWAEHEAAERHEGWSILETESSLAPDDEPFTLEGLPIRGKIDRIDRHPDHGLRVLDFKTRKKPVAVEAAHLRRPRRHEDPGSFPEWMLVDHDNKLHRWTNLQVPLYLIALAERFPEEEISGGYVQLGMAKGDVGLDLWNGLTPSLLDSARACATGVIAGIREGRFWPPSERPEYDDFQGLFFGDPMTAVCPETLSPAISR